MADSIWKGIPIKLIDVIIKRHTDNTLDGEINGTLSNEIGNGEGVFQGIPVSSLLYIIFDDGIMGDIKKKSKI